MLPKGLANSSEVWRSTVNSRNEGRNALYTEAANLWSVCQYCQRIGKVLAAAVLSMILAENAKREPSRMFLQYTKVTLRLSTPIKE